MRGWQEKTNSLGLQVQIPSAKQIALMDNLDFERLALRYADAMRNMGHDSDKMQYVVLPMIKEQIDYVYSPAELSADAVAMYMQTPDAMKKNFPVVAEAIREYVNESDIAKFITFHTVAGLLGAGAMTALLQDAADDEEQGILSLGTGALSSAA